MNRNKIGEIQKEIGEANYIASLNLVFVICNSLRQVVNRANDDDNQNDNNQTTNKLFIMLIVFFCFFLFIGAMLGPIANIFLLKKKHL